MTRKCLHVPNAVMSMSVMLSCGTPACRVSLMGLWMLSRDSSVLHHLQPEGLRDRVCNPIPTDSQNSRSYSVNGCSLPVRRGGKVTLVTMRLKRPWSLA
ncbi:hypothetical protein E2C01_074507 [Portunus trituberculatus]|uniref:Uncharacterized protein n=1 Tax=Portunus trituberculatus TaxID=210409 RepID=A0A5B7IEH0_PORTR|nr:hypothetical protein [Portunus trituberculatus]